MKMKLVGLTETKLFHFIGYLKTGGGEPPESALDQPLPTRFNSIPFIYFGQMIFIISLTTHFHSGCSGIVVSENRTVVFFARFDLIIQAVKV